jgi:hypothetical protein
MKKLPIGIQTFSDFIEENYLYVDKTEYIYRLLTGEGKYYFLSRPRRFGKSLLVSTLREIFSGNRELFKGLWIYDKIDWIRHPVIFVDFLGLNYKTPQRLEETLGRLMDDIAASYGISLDLRKYHNEKFKELVEKLSVEGEVVILIDEYDKPIIDRIEDKETARANRDILRDFYGVIKAVDPYIKFAFITGVSKFSKVSVFSGLNNLDDITLDQRYAAMLGYTQDELHRYFDDRMEAFCKLKELKKEELQDDIKYWYNGYSWDGQNYVYNPFSLLKFFHKSQFSNYWFESATPSFLVKLIKEKEYRVQDVAQLESYKAGESVFESFEIEKMNVTSLLFQTGYLTIREIEPIDRNRRLYVLSYPNIEVKESFMEHLLAEFSEKFADEVSVIIYELRKSLSANQIDSFIEAMKSVFARISYDMFVKDREGYYQTVIYLILMLIGIDIKTEVETNLGRLDAFIETDTHIYIMEFKMGSAREALDQIKEKKYHQGFLNTGKAVTIIGVGFDAEVRNIKEYRSETIS